MNIEGLMRTAYNHKEPSNLYILYWISVPQHHNTHQGYVGVTGLTEVGLGMRYMVELDEVKRGKRTSRTVHKNMLYYQKSVTISIIGKNLTREQAYLLENVLRPNDNTGTDFNSYNWNEVKGGKTLNV